ncbi:hypothetical protein Ciccas_010612 [Cichlidogyrus casuarinus]|uniref:Ig-like domain-containing protein n=1 Tax=Cichlidogyrus casuarinus TaxID=1844966 RepID=A0ABD2PTP1_9PLAT
MNLADLVINLGEFNADTSKLTLNCYWLGSDDLTRKWLDPQNADTPDGNSPYEVTLRSLVHKNVEEDTRVIKCQAVNADGEMVEEATIDLTLNNPAPPVNLISDYNYILFIHFDSFDERYVQDIPVQGW